MWPSEVNAEDTRGATPPPPPEPTSTHVILVNVRPSGISPDTEAFVVRERRAHSLEERRKHEVHVRQLVP